MVRIFGDGFEGHKRRSLDRARRLAKGERIEAEQIITLEDPQAMSKYDIVGEDGTGFEHDGGKGPAECGNCVHMQHDGDGCTHPVMISVSRLPRNDDNYPIVGKHDRCMYVRRPPKK